MCLPPFDSLILETEFDTDEGTVRLVDFMPNRDDVHDVVRLVEGVRSRVRMHMDLRLRFDYGRIVPWVYRDGTDLVAVAGPDAVWLRTPVDTDGWNASTEADFSVSEGFMVPLVVTWQASHCPPRRPSSPRCSWRGPRSTGGSGSRSAPTTASGRTPCAGR